MSGRTVVNAFGDRLENFNVKRGSAPVVPIVLVFVVADDAPCTLESRKLDGGGLGYPRNNLTGIEGENGRVRIDRVGVKYFRKVHGFKDRLGEVGSEWVFIWTTNSETLAPTVLSCMTNQYPEILTWYISAPLLEGPIKRSQQDERGRERREPMEQAMGGDWWVCIA